VVSPLGVELDANTLVTGLRSQFDPQLLGVPLETVRLRWAAESTDPKATQIAYQARTRADATDEWRELEPVESASSFDEVVDDGPLKASGRRDYSVRIKTPTGWTAWSEPLTIEGASPTVTWGASVIDIASEVEGPTPILRREFDLEDITRARLRVSALGIYDVRINGQRATDSTLGPGWTSYQDRILVDTVDVTSLLRPGRNAISITVADGWYRGRMGFSGRSQIYGDRIGAIARLEIESPLGTSTIVTDESWRGGFGPVLFASIYDGTTIDATLDDGDPSEVGYNDSSWSPARTIPFDVDVFVPRAAPPVRVVETFPMTMTTRGHATALDASQNITGWVRLVVNGRQGDTVTVRHAEVLEPDGSLHTAALRTAKATDHYTLAADGRFELEPIFTFHGFRYAEVTGPATVVEAHAVAISSDLSPRSSFSSSHAALNRFHENVRWSQRDNFVSLPTDCPQRDERLGWTGDAQAFAPTANTLFDSESFWGSWLRDLEADQTDEGGVASVVPNIIGPDEMQMGGELTDTMGRAGWADAATIVPLAVYDSYGSASVLEAQLSSMRRWVAHLRRRAGSEVLLPEEPFQYGDWLDPDAPGDRPWAAKVSSLFVANCFYVHSARLLAKAEEILGHHSEADELRVLADSVSAAVWDRWGPEAGETQTGASLCLQFDIVPDTERTPLADSLAAAVRAENGRIATGFLGTPLVLDALSAHGHLEEAYQMLLRRDAPSWLYQVDRGATTVWERWDAIKVDGSIHAGEMDSKEGDSMISFNHYAYGAMIDWVYRTVAGIAPEQPGYRVTRVAPRPATALRHAEAAIATSYGQLAISWAVDEANTLTAEVRVPFGTEALLDLPQTADSRVTVNGGPATDMLTHGTHAIVVTAANVVAVDALAS
jgi:alpha-L-rhamnosidase